MQGQTTDEAPTKPLTETTHADVRAFRSTPSALATVREGGLLGGSQHLGEGRREHLVDQWAGESADWAAPGYISIVERDQRPFVVGLERERGLGPVERHRHARMILCVDPATLLPGGDGFVHVADRLQFDVAASADAARLVADGSGCP